MDLQEPTIQMTGVSRSQTVATHQLNSLNNGAKFMTPNERMENLKNDIINLCTKHDIDIDHATIRRNSLLESWSLIVEAVLEDDESEIEKG
jgi:hypothetical protein